MVAGHPGTAPFEGLLWDSNHPHAARRPASRPVASLSAKGAPLRGQQSFWRVRQPSRDFPVSRSEPVPTGASHYTRRLCSSAQRAPQRLWVVKNGSVPRPPRVEAPLGPPDTTYGAARVAGPGRVITPSLRGDAQGAVGARLAVAAAVPRTLPQSLTMLQSCEPKWLCQMYPSFSIASSPSPLLLPPHPGRHT